MGRVNATFDGGVVAEPEAFTAGSSHGLKFPVYVTHERKNKDSGNYEKTGDTTKIKVTLWNDAADAADIQKGDIVEVTGTLKEREYDKQDGSKGRALETEFVDSVITKYRSNSAPSGFTPDADVPNGFV